MKKYLILIVLVLNLAYISAQTIVSTDIENKKVVLEEFTGIHCGWCPDGHIIAESIVEDNPGNAFVINIHRGSYAIPGNDDPDFRTPFGDPIGAQASITGYPAGTVNRHVFPGMSQNSGTAMSRGHWVDASDIILAEVSYVNMAMEAEIDYDNRELTVLAEVYYTGDSPESSNFLNIALLQDNTIAYQNGGGIFYNHKDRLVWMITGQWGEEIITTTSGSFISQTFTYTIPADYNDIEAVLSDMKLVGFVSETRQEIITGNACTPSYTNFPYNDVVMEQLDVPENVCSNSISPIVEIMNNTANIITELEFEYSVNGEETHTYTWEGSISTLQTESIELDEISFQTSDEYSLNVEVLYSDEDQSNNVENANFYPAPEGNVHIFLDLNTDNAGDQCTWDIRDFEGNILQSGGPYGSNENIQENFIIDPDCNTFNLYDSYGNGGGSVTLSDSDGNQLYYTIGDYGSGASQLFKTDAIESVYSPDVKGFRIFPNPANETVSISFNGSSNIQSITIYDAYGRQVEEVNISMLKQIDIDVREFPTGFYFFRFSNGTVEKVVVK